MVFRFALEASAAAGVERVVFLALRGEEGQVECFWPLSLEAPSTDHPHREMTQLRLLDDDNQAPTLSRAPRKSSRLSFGRVEAID